MPHRFWCCLHSSPPINNPIKILFQNNLGVSDARVKEQKFVISGDKNGSSVLREKKKKCKQNRIQVRINWTNLPNPEFLHRIRPMLGLNTDTGLGPVQMLKSSSRDSYCSWQVTKCTPACEFRTGTKNCHQQLSQIWIRIRNTTSRRIRFRNKTASWIQIRIKTSRVRPPHCAISCFDQSIGPLSSCSLTYCRTSS